MSELPEDLRGIADAIIAALPSMATPAEMLERINNANEATKEGNAEFRLKILMLAGLFIDDALVETPTLDKDSLIRIMASELQLISAFLVRSLKKRIGEEISPARFAIAAYTVAESVLKQPWNAKLAEEVLHDTAAPGQLRAEIESIMAEKQ